MKESKEQKLRSKFTVGTHKIRWSKSDLSQKTKGNRNRIKNKVARKSRQQQRRVKKGLKRIV